MVKSKDDVEDEDEWEGFGSVSFKTEPSNATVPEVTSSIRGTQSKKSSETDIKRKPRHKEQHSTKRGGKSQLANPFKQLENATLEEADGIPSSHGLSISRTNKLSVCMETPWPILTYNIFNRPTRIHFSDTYSDVCYSGNTQWT